jgi:hypothetical protein
VQDTFDGESLGMENSIPQADTLFRGLALDTDCQGLIEKAETEYQEVDP